MSEPEERAKRMGWVPKEEFRGDETKWVDADTFLRRGEEVMPILKENLTRMEGKFENYQRASEAKIDKLTNTLENVVRLSKTASDRAYKKASRDLRSQLRLAAKDGDLQTFDTIEQQLNDLDAEREDAQKIVAEQPAKTDEGIEHPDFAPWHKENMWYGQDPDLTAYANGIGPIVGKEMGGTDGKPFYDEITRKVKEAFPAKFTNPNRKKPDPVEGGEDGGGAPPSNKKKDFRDLPADAKQACDDFVKQGLFKDRQEYVDSYFEEEE